MKRITSYQHVIISILIIISLSISGCNQGSSGISIEEADSLLQSLDIYAMEPAAFIAFSDSIEGLVNTRNKTSVHYFFLDKKYGYNLNHCLASHDTIIRNLVDYNDLTEKAEFKTQELLKNEYFRKFLLSWIDLTAKYTIAEGQSGHENNIFVNTQWDLVNEYLEGSMKDYAMFRLLELQANEYGTEYAQPLITEFMNTCRDKIYKEKTDSLFADLESKKQDAEEYIYRITDTESLSAFVYRTNEKKQDVPCIIIVHGGGWYLGHPLQRNHIPRQWNELGVTSVCIEYRIKGKSDATPLDGLEDVKAAIRWTRKNAVMLGIDPDKIIISGLSAGGHLAAASALIDGFEDQNEDLTISSKPAAAILWSGCIDPTIDNWFRYCMGKMTDEKALSPLHNIKKGDVPFLIFQGTNDEFLDHNSHIDFRDRMTEEENYCKLFLFDGLSHTQIYEQELRDHYREFLNVCFPGEN